MLRDKKWREKYINSNWLNINEDVAYKKITSCNNVNRMKALGKYILKTKCKWENKVRGDYNPTSRVEEVRSQSESRNSKEFVMVKLEH
jgi:hypothetical protein